MLTARDSKSRRNTERSGKRKHGSFSAAIENGSVNDEIDELSRAEGEISRVMDNIVPTLQMFGVRYMNLTWLDSKPMDSSRKVNLNYEDDIISDTALNILSILQRELCNLIEQQVRVKKIVLIQSLVRGWLVRKHVKMITTHLPQIKLSKKIFIELIKAESQYITSLKQAIANYLLPFRAKAACVEDLQDVIAIFSNIETIVELHEQLHREFLQLQDIYWPAVHGLGRLFMNFAVNFQIYGDYAENFTISRTTIANVDNTRKHKLKEVLEHAGGPEKLQKLLELPIKQIGKYENLLGSFASIPQGVVPEELDTLSRAHAIMHNVYELVNRKLKEADIVAKTKEVQRSLLSDRPLNLHVENRYLIQKGTITCQTQKKLVYFLFNDQLILAKQQGDKYRVLHQASLSTATLEIDDTDKVPKAVFTFDSPQGPVKLCLKDEKKQDNLMIIKEQIMKTKKAELVFGVPLTEILMREKGHPNTGGSGVPKIVQYIADYIIKNAVNTEGLMRLPGNFGLTEKLKMLFDNANLTSYESIDLQKHNVHDVAAVLRLYLRELPEPVIPFAFYEPLLEIQRDASIQINDRISAIRKVLVDIPKDHLPLLKFLIQFLQDIEEHSECNKMTVSNLAIIFGPNIIRPQHETVKNALEMPLLQGIIQILMEHSHLFWTKSGQQPVSKRLNRPVSVLFVGENLLPLLDVQQSEEALRTSRSISILGLSRCFKNEVAGGGHSAPAILPGDSRYNDCSALNRALNNKMAYQRSFISRNQLSGDSDVITEHHRLNSTGTSPVKEDLIRTSRGLSKTVNDNAMSRGGHLEHAIGSRAAHCLKSGKQLLKRSKSYDEITSESSIADLNNSLRESSDSSEQDSLASDSESAKSVSESAAPATHLAVRLNKPKRTSSDDNQLNSKLNDFTNTSGERKTAPVLTGLDLGKFATAPSSLNSLGRSPARKVSAPVNITAHNNPSTAEQAKKDRKKKLRKKLPWV